jgi:hypothetical protein
VGDFKGVTALLQAGAASGLKRPGLKLQTRQGRPVKVALAGGETKYPGSVHVSDGASWNLRTYYGRVDADGSTTVTDTDVLELLGRLAADPAGTAAEYGHITGACCFCSTGLEDDRSVEVGYGPVCARKYQLPWGTVAAREHKAARTARQTPPPPPARTELARTGTDS